MVPIAKNIKKKTINIFLRRCFPLRLNLSTSHKKKKNPMLFEAVILEFDD